MSIVILSYSATEEQRGLLECGDRDGLVFIRNITLKDKRVFQQNRPEAVTQQYSMAKKRLPVLRTRYPEVV